MNYDYSDRVNNEIDNPYENYNPALDNVYNYYGIRVPYTDNPNTPKLHNPQSRVDVERVKNNFFYYENQQNQSINNNKETNKINQIKSTKKLRENTSSNYNKSLNNSQTEKYWLNRKQRWNEKIERIRFENNLKESREIRDRPLINKKSADLTKSFSNFAFTENVFERLSISTSKLYNIDKSSRKRSKSPKSNYYFKIKSVNDSDYESFSYSKSKNSQRVSSKRKIDNLIEFYNKNAIDKNKLFKPKSNKKILNRKLIGHCYQTDTFWNVKNENECIRYNNNSSIKESIDNLRNNKLEIYLKMREGKLNCNFQSYKTSTNKITKNTKRSKRMSKKENISKLKRVNSLLNFDRESSKIIDNKSDSKFKIDSNKNSSNDSISKGNYSKGLYSKYESKFNHKQLHDINTSINNLSSDNNEKNKFSKKTNLIVNDNEYVDSEYEILHKNAFNPEYSNKIYSTNKMLKSKVNLIKSYSNQVEGLSSYFINNELKNNFLKEKNDNNIEILYRDDQDNVFRVKKMNEIDLNKHKFRYNVFNKFNNTKTKAVLSENTSKIINDKKDSSKINLKEENTYRLKMKVGYSNRTNSNKSKTSKKSISKKRKNKLNDNDKNNKEEILKIRRKLHHYLSAVNK